MPALRRAIAAPAHGRKPRSAHLCLHGGSDMSTGDLRLVSRVGASELRPAVADRFASIGLCCRCAWALSSGCSCVIGRVASSHTSAADRARADDTGCSRDARMFSSSSRLGRIPRLAPTFASPEAMSRALA